MKNKTAFLLILQLSAVSSFALEMNLHTAENLALENSASIRNTTEQLRLAAGSAGLSLRDFLPQFELNCSSSRVVNTGAPDSESLQLGLSISQPVFDGGRMLKTAALNSMQLNLKSSALQQQIEELRETVWQLFHAIIFSREKLALKRELLAISENQLNISLQKLKLGLLTELDYLETAVEVRNMEIEILDEQFSCDSLIKDFSQLMGYRPNFFLLNHLELTGSLDRNYRGQPLQAGDHLTYELYALGSNPDLKNQEAELRQLYAEYELLKTSWIPRLTLEGTLALRGTALPLQTIDSSFSLKIDFPFEPLPASISAGAGGQAETQSSGSFSIGGKLLPDLSFITDSEAKALELRQGREELNDSITALSRSISESLELIEKKRLRMDILRSSQDLLKKRLDILETRYGLGEIREIDLLEARIDYYGGEIEIREEVLDLLKTERKLEQALGLKFGGLRSISSRLSEGADIPAQKENSLE